MHKDEAVETDLYLTKIMHNLQFDFEKHDQGRLCNSVKQFTEILRNKLEEKRPIYERMKCIHMDDPNLNLGCPLKIKFGCEILNNEHIKAEYLGCLNINDKNTTAGDGTHLFDIFINESQCTSTVFSNDENNSDLTNEERSENIIKLNSNEHLQQFQQDIIQLGESIRSECHGMNLIGFKKHQHGVCCVARYETKGLLIDLIPIVRLSKLVPQEIPCPTIFNHLGTNYQTERYLDLIEYSCSETDLYISSGTERLPGAWSLNSIYRENEVLKRLPPEARKTLAIVTYILRMFIMDNSMEIDPNDPQFLLLPQVNFHYAHFADCLFQLVFHCLFTNEFHF